MLSKRTVVNENTISHNWPKLCSYWGGAYRKVEDGMDVEGMKETNEAEGKKRATSVPTRVCLYLD